jgi:hypothetical protein
MAKQRSKRRRKRTKRQASPQGRRQSKDTRTRVPSAATFFRFHVLDPETMGQMDKATALLRPLLWARDGEDVRQIQQARTAKELIDLLPRSGGLGAPAWHERMGEFGAEVVPLISKRLRTAKGIRDAHVQEMMYDKLIGALRWRGDAGARALLECFDDLSDYGRELASVALGLLGEQAAANRIWRFYQAVVRNPVRLISWVHCGALLIWKTSGWAVPWPLC